MRPRSLREAAVALVYGVFASIPSTSGAIRSRFPRHAPPLIGICISLGMVAIGSVSASADSSGFPIYEGSSIPEIRGPSDPEEYSWKVSLGEEQELVSIDDQHAAVYYMGTEHTAFGISVPPAHDAVGAAVPTSLSVSEGNVITFVVHHRAGNPITGGLFQYPITEGEGWEGGFETFVSQMPPPDPPGQPPDEKAPAGCVVPRLTGRPLETGRKRLRRAGCKLGHIRGERSKTAKVVKQNSKPGELLERGARVSVTLGGVSTPL